MSLLARPLLLLALVFAAGCSGPYYRAMEKIGIHKRDILVDRVEDARESQEAAKVQFSNALEHFIAVTRVPATELARTYDRLSREFERSEARAKETRERIEAIDDVAQALFAEWRQELGQYSSAALRTQSERQLEQTRRRYGDLRRVMDQAASRMDPVLDAFRDQTLFLKHNLNAQSVAALGGTTRELQQDIARLVADMETAIREADAFISALKSVE